MTYRGKTYRLGTMDPCLLPAWWPGVLPAGWDEIDTSPWTGQPDRAYTRAYTKRGTLRVIVTCARYDDGKRWVHLSVSRSNKEIPSWLAMGEVKEVFLGPERTAIQVHPPRSQYVNIEEGVLHIFCCTDGMEFLPDFRGTGGETI